MVKTRKTRRKTKYSHLHSPEVKARAKEARLKAMAKRARTRSQTSLTKAARRTTRKSTRGFPGVDIDLSNLREVNSVPGVVDVSSRVRRVSAQSIDGRVNIATAKLLARQALALLESIDI